MLNKWKEIGDCEDGSSIRELKEVRLNHLVEFMQLTLFYRGPLHSAKEDEPKNAEKHKIRRIFHRQMAELWETHPALEGMLDGWRNIGDENQLANRGGQFITAYQVGDFRFVPLVVKRWWLSCELDVLFLRREPPGYIIDQASGDLDNRLKILFDALRMPKPNSKELPPNAVPDDTEHPFFCLLEDDALITRVSIESDRLLDRQMKTDSEVELVIRAKLKVVKLTYGTVGLGGD